MSSFDGKVVFDLEPAVNIHRVSLETILNSEGSGSPQLNAVLAHLTERYACNDDYTLDLPVYMVTKSVAGNIQYAGHVNGEHTRAELRDKLQKIVNGASNPEGEALPNQ